MTVRPKFKDVPKLPTVRWMTTPPPFVDHSQTLLDTIVERPLYLEQTIWFGDGGNADRYLIGDDCHLAEAGFRWTKNRVCRVAFNALFEGPVNLVVRQQLMVERPWSELQVAVTLNGERLVVRRRTNEPEVIEMTVHNNLKPESLTNGLIFYSNPEIVGKITGGQDMRLIGIGLKSLHFARNV